MAPSGLMRASRISRHSHISAGVNGRGWALAVHTAASIANRLLIPRPQTADKQRERELMRNIVRILRYICWILLAPAAWSQTSLADISLEDLLKVQVTSVSKKEQTLARTAASVSVIGADEIRRSGAENLPDLLRAVPGVNVAQIDAGAWAISIRGMNGRYSSKVLVMVDGRAVYASMFGGVYWDQIDLPLESVERVEVIRGSGGTIWGANAVNGVI